MKNFFETRGKCSTSVPQMYWMPPRNAIATPNDANAITPGNAPRRRIVRYTSRSTTTAKTATTSTPIGNAMNNA